VGQVSTQRAEQPKTTRTGMMMKEARRPPKPKTPRSPEKSGKRAAKSKKPEPQRTPGRIAQTRREEGSHTGAHPGAA